MVKITKKSKSHAITPTPKQESSGIHITKKFLIFICNWVDTPSQTPIEDPMNEFGSTVKIVRVMCTSRVSRPMIIKAIEEGFDHVVIVGCAECKNKAANSIAQKRVNETTALLSHTGIKNGFLYYKTIQPNSDLKYLIIESLLELEKA
jgi:coenzyme F420-reducing hydrogenase delta subunit